ncbi:MAG: hypothetical protein A3G08_04000 [Candidatus Magasanikbacteria bacterium RIFCSPLOWO2_12_FULL_47_9b]|nr:MAG: hypothetical protein A3I74_04545 [Candidatus Magasanikbacteria bacterium RIFCSPLOWO2_02_FULL_47_16]OGH79477.1 MAG: hypothetical protein A3C10_01515 [Candidatus Magasanikbacteria bacterium RIFCSPHIGHO2_02_FULL_48_18]OGH83507.1 MAG: hypothetical protein A3G08_04000 [Candidatus Magasanikbacteria bacterium RIFCSPLOWO2_12_FULL_47_9b]
MQKKILIPFLCMAAVMVFLFFAHRSSNTLRDVYQKNESVAVRDRHGALLSVLPNPKGYYAIYATSTPQSFAEMLIAKEDRFFYAHPGINPISTIRGAIRALENRPPTSSTLAQQLVKILLENEQERTVRNKITEAWYAIALELFTTKHEILEMYANSAYFGNQIQGVHSASLFYFGARPEALSTEQTLSLLAAMNAPSADHPFSGSNAKKTELLANRLNISFSPDSFAPVTMTQTPGNFFVSPEFFELRTAGVSCAASCRVSIDEALSKKIRAILNRDIERLAEQSVQNGAVVVFSFPKNELLAMVGSLNPLSDLQASKINMAIQPRPIGSTIKPFLFLKGFEQGLRPYSLVDDREYKYAIADTFAFYPKNYNYQYHGIVSLQYALANSLNVPSVKVLEYIGLDSFYHFLEDDLGFLPLQPLNTYQLGIALGGLEMDLLTLSHYFTIFSQHGMLKPLEIMQENPGQRLSPPMEKTFPQPKLIADDAYIQLVNAILSDRKTGIDAFGLVSPFNLFADNYALKTGTSREYHDSWIIGYTPDFLVGVWVGNADNTAMDAVSGQNGAGRIWHDVMEVLLNSPYHRRTPFPDDALTSLLLNGTATHGLPKERPEGHLSILLDTVIITSPHQSDVILLEPHTAIPLHAKTSVDWFVNDVFLSSGPDALFEPTSAGTYRIRAMPKDDKGKEETITLFIEEG